MISHICKIIFIRKIRWSITEEIHTRKGIRFICVIDNKERSVFEIL